MNLNIHKIFSPILYKSGAYKRGWQNSAINEPFTVVLTYHRVVEDGQDNSERFDIECGVPASVFEAQIRFMLKHFAPVKASQVLEPSAENLRFAVTLDDGYEDNYQIAAPILSRLKVPATFFVVSDYVGTDRLFWWEQVANMIRDTEVPEIISQELSRLTATGLPPSLSLLDYKNRDITYKRLCAAMRSGPHNKLHALLNQLSDLLEVKVCDEGRGYGLMDWAQLKELTGRGFEIGGHTATHCNVVGAGQEMLQTELVSSHTTIEDHIGEPVLTFAYPYGHYDKQDNSTVVSLLEATNCRIAFTTGKNVARRKSKVYELPRTQLNRRYGFACAYNIQDTLNNS